MQGSGSLGDRPDFRLADPGTGGNRDTYNPSHGSIASQAQHTADLEREAAMGGKKGLRGVSARLMATLRRLFRRV